MRVTTLATDVSKPKPSKLKPLSIRDTSEACKGSHEKHKYPVFLAKNVNWCRRFSRFNALSYRCLSPSHLQRKFPHKGWLHWDDCAHTLNHHPLLHLLAPIRSQVYQEKENSRQRSSPAYEYITRLLLIPIGNLF